MKKHRLVMTGLALALCLLLPLGQPRPAFASSYVVNTTDDSNDGTCDSTHCSLREAIVAANNHTGDDYIHVIIPQDDPGCDGVVCTITLGTDLPSLADSSGGTVVDATSQPDTNPNGPDIVVNGSGSYWCFSIVSQYNTVKGFVINACEYGVVVMHAVYWEPAYNTVSANYIGINYDGTAAAGNTHGGVWIDYAHDNTIGGTTAQERNVISGNDDYGIQIDGAEAHHNRVIGNYIGTNADGTAAVPNVSDGIQIQGDAHDNTIGGLTSGERNVISGNLVSGVAIDDGANYNRVIGDYIGTDASRANPMPNSLGVFITGGAHDNIIGGTIACNAYHGVRVDGAATTGNTITATRIHSNGEKAIWLSNGGNGGILPPSIATPNCNSVGGTAPVGRTIMVYSDYDGQGRQFHGEDQVSGGGTWMVTLPSGMFTYPNLTATATDTSGNTSEFSAPVRNGCDFAFLPLGTKRY
jgi:CSLREA domain-containing protein